MKRCIFFLTFLLSIIYSNAQGLIFDSVAFSKIPELSIERGIMPSSYSLEKYLPILLVQRESTCVAVSFSLARTMMLAIENNITDKQKITRSHFSPYFLYYLARKKDDLECLNGLSPVIVGEIAKTVGFERLINVEYPNYYPFSDNFLCPSAIDFFPPELDVHVGNAKRYRINELYGTKNIEGIKYSISHNIPVVLGLQIPISFKSVKSNFWTPLLNENRSKSIGGHAVVAVAYNDLLNGGSILIANSWGVTWGLNGLTWIRYRDLQNWMDGAFIMEPTFSYKSDAPINLPKSTNNLKSQIFKIEQFGSKYKFDNKVLLEVFKN
jgi:hypothetical protein